MAAFSGASWCRIADLHHNSAAAPLSRNFDLCTCLAWLYPMPDGVLNQRLQQQGRQLCAPGAVVKVPANLKARPKPRRLDGQVALCKGYLLV